VNAHLRAIVPSKRARELIAEHRSFEWTPAADGLGHPHFHVYLWGPFLPAPAVLHGWWKDALRTAGYRGPRVCEACRAPTGEHPWCAEHAPIVPFLKEIVTKPEEIAREVDKGRGHNLRTRSSGAEDVHSYACGWTIAEYAQGEGRASETVLARVYEALTDHRLSQSSTRFLPPRLTGCPHCGALGTVRLEWERGAEIGDVAERIAIACDGGPAPSATGPPCHAHGGAREQKRADRGS
jgi:hypothetical protein